MWNATDAIQELIERAVEGAVRKALNIDPATNRRLLSIEEAGVYLTLSKREVYNMIANQELLAVHRGRRVMIDIRDLEKWVESNKR